MQLASPDFTPFERIIGQPSPECVRRFYEQFDLTNAPGEFFNLPAELFHDILQVQYFNIIEDVSNAQVTDDATYFRFAASPDELDWWFRIDRQTARVAVCSTWADNENPLRELECSELTFATLIESPYRVL